MKIVSRLLLVLALLALVLTVVLPTAAQDESSDDELVLVTGELEFDDGNIIVSGYIIAPAGAFIPASVEEGDTVIITGYLLSDGETIQALSFEIAEGDSDDSGEMSDEADEDALGEEESIERGYFCTEDSGLLHPAGVMLSDEFDAEYEDIMAAFCEEGYGFGEIMLAYLLAEATGEDAQTFLDARGEGLGWGQIMLQSEVHPAEVFTGRVFGEAPWGEEGIFSGPPVNIPAGSPGDTPAGPPANVSAGPPADTPAGQPASAPAGPPASVPAGPPASGGRP